MAQIDCGSDFCYISPTICAGIYAPLLAACLVVYMGEAIVVREDGMSIWRPLFVCVLLFVSLAALPTFAAAPLEMTAVGELAYGIPHDVAIDGNYAYVAAQGAVSVLDITIPAHPVQVAVIDTAGSAEGIAVSGGYAYIADWDSGLAIMDVSNPTDPHRPGVTDPDLPTYHIPIYSDTPGFAYGVAVSGNYAYVADHAGGLQIIDVTTKTNPTLASSYDTDGYAWNIALAASGGRVYVADGFAGLLTLDVGDVSDPDAPIAVPNGSYAAEDQVLDVAVSDNYAYLADGTAGLKVVDISVGPPFSLAGSLPLTGRASGIVVSDTLAYIAAGTAGLHVVDITDPAVPPSALLGSFDTTGVAYAVAVSGSAAYVADDSGGLRIIEVGSDPAPVIVGNAATAGTAEGVALQDGYAYVADSTGGVCTFDVTEPTAPTATPGGIYTGPNAMDVAVGGTYLYVANWSGTLEVLSIAIPTSPAFAASCPITSPPAVPRPNGLALTASRAYVASGDAGLAVVDITDPAAPSLLRVLDTDGSANGVVYSGSYAYVADGGSGLQILDPVAPTASARVGTGATPGGYAWDVAVSGDYAYVASGDAGLMIFDVNPPALGLTPEGSISGAELGGSAHSIWVEDSYAFISVGGRGVVVVNVSDPAAPFVVTSVGTPSVPGPADLAIAPGYAYVADAESGLVVVDIVSPYIELAALDSPACAQRLDVIEPTDGSGVGYMAAGPQGLQIVQVTDATDPDNPSLVRSVRSLGEVNDVALASPYAYVTDTAGRLSLLNVANPVNPYTVGPAAETSGSALGVAAATIGASPYALVAGGYEGLSTVAISENPSERAVNDTPGWCSDVAATTLGGDPFALVADGDAGLRLFNLSPVGTPAVTFFSEDFELEESLERWNRVPIYEWYAGSAAYVRGSHGIQLRQTGSIQRTISTAGFSELTVSFYWRAANLEADDSIVADWSRNGGLTWTELDHISDGDGEESALTYFSTSLPTAADDNPSFVLRFRILGHEGEDYAYVDDIAIKSEGSSQPTEVGFYNTAGQAKGVAVSGNYALVADGVAGLRIIDISSPGSPLEVGFLNTDGEAEAVTAYGTVAAVADGSNGLVFVSFASPTAPVEIAHFDTPGWATDVKILGGHAWIADSGWGLAILQLWHSFPDILFWNWAFSEIESAVENGITVGYPDGEYHPEITCSRDQMCVFVARAMEWVGPDDDLTLTQYEYDHLAGAWFTDVDPEHPNWAERAIYLCKGETLNGANTDKLVVVEGYLDNAFRPAGSVTRALMCIYIARANEWIGPPPAPMDTAPELFPDVPAGFDGGTAIQACMNYGVVRGYPDGYYRPYIAVTRDQMAVFIWRAFLRP